MIKLERLASALKSLRGTLAAAVSGRSTAEGRDSMRGPAGPEGNPVDVSEFVAVSQQHVDPVALATEFDRDFERVLSDHRMSREQLETPVTV